MIWRLTHVSIAYRLADGSCVQALRNVSLDVRLGERIAVVGSNGAGKSALALCLAGLIPPAEGRVSFASEGSEHVASGRDTNLADLDGDLRAALVFQNPDDNLIAQTVREEISLTLEHATQQRVNQAAIKNALSRFQLDHLEERQVAHLSGGEKQRLAVACAFASERPLIILDEPTSHLDPPSRRYLVNSLVAGGAREFRDDDGAVAVVLITQYPDEARLFPRVVALEDGGIQYDGPGHDWTPSRTRGKRLTIPARRHEVRNTPILSTTGLTQVDHLGWPLPPLPLVDVTITVHAGDAIGLCGPIGAGKSSLGYHLAGLAGRFSGEVRRHPPTTKGHLPVVLIQFPERQLFCSTILDDVAWGPEQRGVAQESARRTATQLLNRLQLPSDQYAHRSPFALSGGQRRKVAIGGVAACPAPLYILDEPSAALDAQGTSQLEELLGEWHGSGAAYIVISHDLAWLGRVTSRVWVLDKGRVCFDGHWDDRPALDQVLEHIGFEE